MDEDDSGQGRSDLWRALKRLTEGRGIQRDDLLEALAGDLSELQRCWGVNLRNGSKVAKDTVGINLSANFRNITPPALGANPGKGKKRLSREEHLKRYWHCVQVSFNMGLEKWPELLEMDITERRRWLEDKMQVSTSTRQRYLNNAITQIENQILASGYMPVSVDEHPDPETLPVVQTLEESSSAPASITQPLQVVDVKDAQQPSRLADLIRPYILKAVEFLRGNSRRLRRVSRAVLTMLVVALVTHGWLWSLFPPKALHVGKLVYVTQHGLQTYKDDGTLAQTSNPTTPKGSFLTVNTSVTIFCKDRIATGKVTEDWYGLVPNFSGDPTKVLYFHPIVFAKSNDLVGNSFLIYSDYSPWEDSNWPTCHGALFSRFTLFVVFADRPWYVNLLIRIFLIGVIIGTPIYLWEKDCPQRLAALTIGTHRRYGFRFLTSRSRH